MILDRIVKHKWGEVARRKEAIPLEALIRQCQDLPGTRGFRKALTRSPSIALIAEIKKASPSKGVIRETFHPVTIARTYEEAGASAISVLTDEAFFQGQLAYLTQVRQAVSLPLLRKDFILDPYQVYEARAAGADAILLIVACLSETTLRELLDLARQLELDALVEVHDAEELQRALDVGASLIGINNRNLRTFETTIETTLRLSSQIPRDRTVVSESGIQTRKDVERLARCGVDAILVGESLMRSSDIRVKVRELLET